MSLWETIKYSIYIYTFVSFITGILLFREGGLLFIMLLREVTLGII